MCNEKDECICEKLTLFDMYSSNYPSHSERCMKCGKIINQIKAEYILNRPIGRK